MRVHNYEPNKRLRRLMKALSLEVQQIAEIFGVTDVTASLWVSEKAQMRFEFQQTLLRLESENLAKLAPGVSRATVRAFQEGRTRTANLQR
jgi:hypothetical protein